MKYIRKIIDCLTTRFFLRTYLILIMIIVIQKVCGVAYITDGMALGSMGFVASLIGLDKLDKKSQ